LNREKSILFCKKSKLKEVKSISDETIKKFKKDVVFLDDISDESLQNIENSFPFYYYELDYETLPFNRLQLMVDSYLYLTGEIFFFL
ncbi:hypothetical protein, partial [Xanthovirga aplysinae]|uniref:hypothetical protein n=1 Tax=Xanthovirga aplysinae TaxID=2529853 RepID=UPI001CA44AAE